MDIEEIGGWEEGWSEKLYKRDYENLPDFMMDCLWEYFGDGGTAEEFNSRYKFGSRDDIVVDVANLVEAEYKEYTNA